MTSLPAVPARTLAEARHPGDRIGAEPDDRIGAEPGGLRLLAASAVMAEPETPAVAGRSVMTGVPPAQERVAVSAGRSVAGTAVLGAVRRVRGSGAAPC